MKSLVILILFFYAPLLAQTTFTASAGFTIPTQAIEDANDPWFLAESWQSGVQWSLGVEQCFTNYFAVVPIVQGSFYRFSHLDGTGRLIRTASNLTLVRYSPDTNGEQASTVSFGLLARLRYDLGKGFFFFVSAGPAYAIERLGIVNVSVPAQEFGGQGGIYFTQAFDARYEFKPRYYWMLLSSCGGRANIAGDFGLELSTSLADDFGNRLAVTFSVGVAYNFAK